MVGRKTEIKTLELMLKENKSSFLAVTGRRRVGKTYLIDKFFEKKICFRMTGIQDQGIDVQLKNFAEKLFEHSKVPYFSVPKNWQSAFVQLKQYLQTLPKNKKQVIFFDELPWVVTPKSGCLKFLAHLWNDYLSKNNHFILVVCGSASSWITKNIINDKGGLHNRLTSIVRLNPFTLYESKEFLKSRSIRLTNQEIAKLYMAFGGIPYYLEQIRKGESATQAIERLCFKDRGMLKNEYNNLYKALFKNSYNHESIVFALAKKSSGMTRKEILSKSKIRSGGEYTRTMNELLQSGFISEFIPFGRKKRGVMYRLNDEYSIFYHRFIQPNKKYNPGIWNQISVSQSYKIWTGYAFENLCYKHINQVKQALGILGVYTEISGYRVEGTKNEGGFQIDLIIDRKDNTINLCEMKYYDATFKIDKKYATTLRNRKQRFIEHAKTKKQVFNTLITNHGILENEYAQEIVDSEVVLDNLFVQL